jgi:hypothetical protein
MREEAVGMARSVFSCRAFGGLLMTIAELARAANGTSGVRAAFDMTIGVVVSLLCLSAYAFLLWVVA